MNTRLDPRLRVILNSCLKSRSSEIFVETEFRVNFHNHLEDGCYAGIAAVEVLRGDGLERDWQGRMLNAACGRRVYSTSTPGACLDNAFQNRHLFFGKCELEFSQLPAAAQAVIAHIAKEEKPGVGSNGKILEGFVAAAP